MSGITEAMYTCGFATRRRRPTPVIVPPVPTPAINASGRAPPVAAATWSRILNRPVEGDIIRLDGAQIRFVPIVDGRGPGVSAYDVKVVDRERVLAAAHTRGKQRGPAQVEVCGCRINLV